MTGEEIRKRYQIPKAALTVYDKQVRTLFYGDGTGEGEYDDRDVERIGMVMTYQRMGFEDQEVGAFFRMEQEGEATREQRLHILKKHRLRILDEIHKKERILGELDFLRYELGGA